MRSTPKYPMCAVTNNGMGVRWSEGGSGRRVQEITQPPRPEAQKPSHVTCGARIASELNFNDHHAIDQHLQSHLSLVAALNTKRLRDAAILRTRMRSLCHDDLLPPIPDQSRQTAVFARISHAAAMQSHQLGHRQTYKQPTFSRSVCSILSVVLLKLVPERCEPGSKCRWFFLCFLVSCKSPSYLTAWLRLCINHSFVMYPRSQPPSSVGAGAMHVFGVKVAPDKPITEIYGMECIPSEWS